MTKIHDLINLGQSIWFDYIRRSFTKNGDLQKLLDQGARGVTSNPAIFEKAIAGSSDYDADINRLVNEGKSVGKIYETLALEDIAQAADLLRPLYDESSGGDGYVSLEVSPTLAHNTQGTIAEAKRLFATLGRPNVMIKIPATAAGIPALTRADIGIAIGGGTDVAIESAGIILVQSNPLDVVKVIALSRASYRKMQQNLLWATGYNVIALPLAAGVLAPVGILLSPAIGALFMSLSTIIVAINAQFLRREQLGA
jgi:hypothetical protein